MKKILLAIFLCGLLPLVNNAAAAESGEQKQPLAWEISVQPKPSAEEREAAGWSLIVENDIGVYAYDMNSLAYEQSNGSDDKNIVNVKAKTVFTGKDVLKKLQEQYGGKLQKKEKVQYCLLDMQYKMAEKLYTVKRMEVYTNKNRLIDTKKNKTFASVPEKSFAEALYEICEKFRNTEAAG